MTNPSPPGPARSRIRYAEDEFEARTLERWLDVQDARASMMGRPRPPRPLGEAPDAAPVLAYMNYGRWVADCDCAAAVMLFRGAPGKWFWCPACGNASTSGKLRPVVWPANRAQLDTDMASVPAAVANWRPAAPAANIGRR